MLVVDLNCIQKLLTCDLSFSLQLGRTTSGFGKIDLLKCLVIFGLFGTISNIFLYFSHFVHFFSIKVIFDLWPSARGNYVTAR